MAGPLPLPSALSQVLTAYTIEFDNEYEHRMLQRARAVSTPNARVRPRVASMAMWSNFMRYVGIDGLSVREVNGLAKITNLAGLERWGYVSVAPDPSVAPQNAPRPNWIVRPTTDGQAAQDAWRPLAGVIEARWRERFGARQIDDLRESLHALVIELNVELPRFMPVVPPGNGMRADQQLIDGWTTANRTGADDSELDLPALMSRVLLAFTLDFERESSVSLTINANVLRVLGDESVAVRDLPYLSGVSQQGIAMAVGYLARCGYAAVEPGSTASRGKNVRLTPPGRMVRDDDRRVFDLTGLRWRERFGNHLVEHLHKALHDLINRRDGEESLLAQGLEPYPDGWRASKPYVGRTAAVLRDPGAALPHHPMVLHRGGWPDAS